MFANEGIELLAFGAARRFGKFGSFRIVAVQWEPRRWFRGWRRVFQQIGSVAILLSPLSLLTAFFAEPAFGLAGRSWQSYIGLIGLFAGVMTHIVASAGLRLMTHPGVGPLTALAFVLIIGTPERFQRGKQIGTYVGMIPV